MGKKLKKKSVADSKKVEFYKKTNTFGNIEKLIFPNTLQVGLNSDIFNSTISGSIHHTRQGISYLVAGNNIAIVSGSNGQVTISATAGATGPATPDVSFTRSTIPVDTDDTGGALDDGNDLADADISDQAFTKLDVNAGTTNVTFAGHNVSGDPSSNTYKIITGNMTAFTDNGTELTESNDASGEGDATFNVTFANSGTRLALQVTTTSSDAKFRVTSLSEHEDGSNTDFNSVIVNVPVKVTTAAGTQTITRSFTVQKIKKGTTGNTGTGTAGSGVAINLDPLSVLLVANSAGSVSDFTPSGATIKVYENGSIINVNTSLASNSTWYVVSATGTNITAGSISQTNGQNSATIADASSITADTATIAHVVRVKNSLGVTTDYTMTQTLAKAKTGATGDTGASGAADDVAVFLIEKTGDSNIVLDNASGLNTFRGSRWGIKQDGGGTQTNVGASTANTDVVSSFSNGSGASDEAIFTVAATASYRIEVTYTDVRNANVLTAINDAELAVYTDTGSGYSEAVKEIFSIGPDKTVRIGTHTFFISLTANDTFKVGWRNTGGSGTNGSLRLTGLNGMARLVIEKL